MKILDVSISIHALREEGDGFVFCVGFVKCVFLSTPSARRATAAVPRRLPAIHISIHALREEGDPACSSTRPAPSANFYPRPPRGGRRSTPPPSPAPLLFLSTPSARRATHFRHHCQPARGDFYPRPPRGGRPNPGRRITWTFSISIHALREEGDCSFVMAASSQISFLSTPSARRATRKRLDQRQYPGHFYPRPPRGGRRAHEIDGLGNRAISIHALREEGDTCSRPGRWSTEISIHALREEGDRGNGRCNYHRLYFYPRPPRGGRPGRTLPAVCSR